MNNLRYIAIGVLHQLEKALSLAIDQLTPKRSLAEKDNSEIDRGIRIDPVARVSGTASSWPDRN